MLSCFKSLHLPYSGNPCTKQEKESQRWCREKEIYMDVKNRCIATPVSFPKLSSRRSWKLGLCQMSRSVHGGARMVNIISVPITMILIYERKSTICYLFLLLTDRVFLSSLETMHRKEPLPLENGSPQIERLFFSHDVLNLSLFLARKWGLRNVSRVTGSKCWKVCKWNYPHGKR